MVELADTLASGASERTLMGVQVPLRARASDFEQYGEIARVSYKRKTARPFFDSRLFFTFHKKVFIKNDLYNRQLFRLKNCFPFF